MVNISLDHGNAASSSDGYMAYAMFIANMFGQYEEAYAYGCLALELNKKFEHAYLVGKLNEMFAVFIMFYRRPLRETLECLDRGYQASLAAGELTYLSYTAAMIGAHKMGLGEELGELGREVDRYGVLLRRTGEAFCTAMNNVTRWAIQSLTARAESPGGRCDEITEERALRDEIGARGMEMAASFYCTLKAQILFLHERHADALSMADHVQQRISSRTTAHFTTELPFYTCLILAALHPSATEAERERYDAEISRRQAQMERWADGCPENFRHRLLLIQAERARLAGSADAVRLYDQAIEAARESGFPHHEALASELCAKFYLGLGSAPVASMYMTAAHAGYLRWGAAAKVAQIEEKYSSLLVETAARRGTPRAPSRARRSPPSCSTSPPSSAPPRPSPARSSCPGSSTV